MLANSAVLAIFAFDWLLSCLLAVMNRNDSESTEALHHCLQLLCDFGALPKESLRKNLQDDFTYERSAIELWLEKHETSPMTNEILSSKELHSNLVVKQMAATLRAR